MKVNILGTQYSVEFVPYDEDPKFKQFGFCGYCTANQKKIVVCDLNTHPNWVDDPDEAKQYEMNTTVRHEVVHAFFFESGLANASTVYDSAWAQNEEMVDWFAIQGPKIFTAWKELKVL